MDNTDVPPIALNKDEEHLRLLATFHYVLAGLGALFACLPLIHVALGVMMLANPEFMSGVRNTAEPSQTFAGVSFIVIGGLFVLLGWAAAACTYISGRFLAQRRNRMFSFVVAALLCAFTPCGTVLGVFTLIVLSRDSVQRLYESTKSTAT